MPKARNIAANDSFESLGYEQQSLKQEHGATNGINTLAKLQESVFGAFFLSSRIVSEAIEYAAVEQASFLRSQYDQGMTAASQAASSKSIDAALAIQLEFARQAFDSSLEHGVRMTECWATSVRGAAEPLTTAYGELVAMAQSYRP